MGVELYTQQLALAASQEALEKGEKALKDLAAQRAATEAQLKELQQQVQASGERLVVDRQEVRAQTLACTKAYAHAEAIPFRDVSCLRICAWGCQLQAPGD